MTADTRRLPVRESFQTWFPSRVTCAAPRSWSRYACATPPLAALPAGVTHGATVEGITECALASGLRVLL